MILEEAGLSKYIAEMSTEPETASADENQMFTQEQNNLGQTNPNQAKAPSAKGLPSLTDQGSSKF
jgi:hypothetical protein